ncbi:MAG: P-II family nitrogen regulator [Christensenellales bacterium]|jgi:nitrogen regulatory protein P-II 1
MQLLVFISNQSSKMPEVLSSLVKVGVSGATVVNCEGMARLLGSEGSDEATPMFGAIRSLFNSEYEQGQLLLAVMPDELILPAKEAIKKICGSFDQPNTGIMFTVPVMHFEGVRPIKK